MNSQTPHQNPIVKLWLKIKEGWLQKVRRGSAFSRSGTVLRVLVLVSILLIFFLAFLIYADDIFSLGESILKPVQEARLTRQPYTATPTVTNTKQPSLTPTDTITPTPTGTLPKASKTPTAPTATFTQTPTATRPVVELGSVHSDTYYRWRERISDTWLWRHLYSIFVGVVLASWLTVTYIRDVYGLRRFIRSAGFLVRIILMLPVGTLTIKGGNLVDDEGRIVGPDWILLTGEGQIVRKNGQPVTAVRIQRTLRLLRVGIPARLKVEADSCVVIEGRGKQSLVCGPTGGPVLLMGFTRLRRTIDLRDTKITINLRQPTRDGILLSVDDLPLIFSIYRGGKVVQGNIYPYDEQAVFDLVYRYWLEGDWLPEMTARISAALRQYISENSINDFLPYLSTDGESAPNLNQRENPFYIFVDDFNKKVPRRCIQLQWLGYAKWRLASEIDLKDLLERWQESIDQLLELPEKFSVHPSCAENNPVLIDLIRQVPLAVMDRLLPTEGTIPQRSIRAVIMVYREKLIEVLHLYQQKGQTPPRELVDAIHQLSDLILRKIGGAG